MKYDYIMIILWLYYDCYYRVIILLLLLIVVYPFTETSIYRNIHYRNIHYRNIHLQKHPFTEAGNFCFLEAILIFKQYPFIIHYNRKIKCICCKEKWSHI